jgi:dUTP pyrophosphatase
MLIKRLPHNLDLPLPAYETAGAAGMDLRAALPSEVTINLYPGTRAAVPTGLAMVIPQGFVALVCPRSGLSLRNGVMCASPGVIDSDYRGEIYAIVINHGQEMFCIKRGDRIAQLMIMPVYRAKWQEVDELEATARGANGFGSTGNG